MEEETNNSELIIETENQPNPEPKQEEAKQEEKKKMSDVDLSKLSLEELQAAIEKKKAEEKAKNKFTPNENDPSDLAKFIQTKEMLPLAKCLNVYALDRTIAEYPGKLTKFAYLKDENREPTTDKEKVRYIHIVSVDGECVIDAWVSNISFDAFPIILKKI